MFCPRCGEETFVIGKENALANRELMIKIEKLKDLVGWIREVKFEHNCSNNNTVSRILTQCE